jgi:uncharacterized protein (TIGR02147 family)
MWANDDYRAVLKEKVHRLKKDNPKLSFASLAAKLGIQQSYLSRGLHHDKTHLNDDHFDEILGLLDFTEIERDYLWLLRQLEVSQSRARRERLKGRIESLRKSHLTQTLEKSQAPELVEEVLYLSDPMHVVVHVALNISKYKKNPFDLCSPLGLSHQRMSQILDALEKAGYLTRGRGAKSAIEEVKQGRIHFGPKHPLMKTHQLLLRNLSASWLHRVEDGHKKMFSVTLSSDEALRADVERRFNEFLQGLQKDSAKYPSKRVFQMNFDFFQILD